MSTAGDHLRAILAGLPDTFALSSMTLNPAIPTGKHGVVFHRVGLAPVENLAGRFRQTTWAVAVISPVTGPEAAGDPLDDALDVVLDVLEAEPTLQWTTATFEPYNDRLWCYSVEVTLYNELVPEPEPVPDLLAMTVAELTTYASDHQIKLSGARRKAEIVDVIAQGME